MSLGQKNPALYALRCHRKVGHSMTFPIVFIFVSAFVFTLVFVEWSVRWIFGKREK